MCIYRVRNTDDNLPVGKRLSVLNAQFLYIEIGEGYLGFYSPVCDGNNCFDGFSLTENLEIEGF